MDQKGTSLQEVNGTIDATKQTGFWKKLFAFMGPAYLISVGYMDPGNWATDIAGGSQFGYALIWVLVASNLIALLLQSLSARLGLVTGLDLAQASRATYPKAVSRALWLLAEAAIAACDLAEVLGMAIGLQLLFHIPLLYGVSLTILDTFLLLILVRYGMRKMEAFILALIAIMGIAFLLQMSIAKPSGTEILKGLIPSLPGKEALYITIGIIGATVMPHNLYLHSSLVQTRTIRRTSKGIRSAIRFNFLDTFIALNLAMLVNASILILAAVTFFNNGFFAVAQIQDAHRLLAPILGNTLAPVLFAVALIAAGQSSTLTGTLSGQIVMEGYLNLRIQPWLRRIITRLIAILPAFLVIRFLGESRTGDLLVLSQVILCLQLGFAIIPLIHFVSDASKMKQFVIPPWVKALSWSSALLIIGLNAKLIYDFEHNLLATSDKPWIWWLTLLPATGAAALLLLYVTLFPWLQKSFKERKTNLHSDHQELQIRGKEKYNRIAITVDFSNMDSNAISNAVAQGGKEATYLLIHVVETAGARIFENEISDNETASDRVKIKQYQDELSELGYHAETRLGFGNPKNCIPELVTDFNADLLVMAAHGHRGFRDIVFGTTLDAVRHSVNVPVLIVVK
jgi:manganese transport protein